MRVSSLLALLLFIAGGALLFYGLSLGEGELYLFLVFPVIVARGPISLAGSLVLVSSLILAFLSLSGILAPGVFSGSQTQDIDGLNSQGSLRQGERRRFGGIVLLGPIPLVFGSDVRVTTAMLIVGAVLTLILILLLITALGG